MRNRCASRDAQTGVRNAVAAIQAGEGTAPAKTGRRIGLRGAAGAGTDPAHGSGEWGRAKIHPPTDESPPSSFLQTPTVGADAIASTASEAVDERRNGGSTTTS